MRILVVSYATEDGYREEAARLKKSLDLFDVEHLIHSLPPFRTWSEAVSHKPAFLCTMLETLRERDGMLWLDADAELVKRPDFSIFDGAHAAWHRFRRTKNHEEEFLTGTMFFANTPLVAEFLRAWREATSRHRYRDCPEQESLKWVFTKPWQAKLVVRDLPAEWVWIDDMAEVYGARDPVILQHQASRRLK